VSAELAERHALVTGGGRGIGAAIARGLLEHGARVTLLGRNIETLDAQIATLRASGDVQATAADVSDEDAVKAAFTAARARFGDVNILVNNAGIARSAPFAATERALWQTILDVNLTGTFLCCREAVPAMRASGYGRIVNVASTAGLVGGPYIAAYSAAKAGVIGMTRSLASELARSDITVNAVCPGFTETDMLDDAIANITATTKRTAEEARVILAAANASRKFITADEVANAVLWLCLPGSGAVSGQAIVVSGGEARPA
jgi:3-hydroxybutyrate dehydrogenase